MVGTCEYSNELSVSIKCGEFLDWLQNQLASQEGLCSMEYVSNEVSKTFGVSLCRLQFTLEFFELHTHSTVNGSASLSELHSPVGFYFNMFYFSCKLRKQIMFVSKKLH